MLALNNKAIGTYHPAVVMLLGTSILLGFPSVSLGQWPQWRGVGRDGAVSGPSHKGSWPAKLDLLWARDVGEGYSGPVVAGDHVWIHSRQGEKEVVSSFQLSSGALIWSRTYDVSFQQDENARMHGKGPYATPSFADGRLFTFSVTSVLSVWDAESGNLIWRRESAKDFDPSFPYFGAASSPLVWNDLCFVHLGGHKRSSGTEHPGTGAIVALNVSDGREQWRWGGDAPAAGASPVICRIEKVPNLVFKTMQNIVSLDPRSGMLLWQIPFKVSQDNTIVTPLFEYGRLLTSDYDEGIGAWRIQSNGTSWTVTQVWKHRAASLFMSSPVLASGLLVGFSHFRKGQLFVLDPNNGDVLWQGDPRSGEHATLISWGNEVLAFLEDGSMLVGEVSRNGFRLLQRYNLGSAGGWAHPALSDNRLLMRDGSRLLVYQVELK
jgi:outer membrane protein assembly factor BamB